MANINAINFIQNFQVLNSISSTTVPGSSNQGDQNIPACSFEFWFSDFLTGSGADGHPCPGIEGGAPVRSFLRLSIMGP
jgi:hypothetical protein